MGVLIERHEKKALCDVEFTKENHLPEIHEIVKMETPFFNRRVSLCDVYKG